MLIVLVHVKVKEQYIQQFIIATKENAEQSVKEPGVERFDVFQEQDALQNFLLSEVYKDAKAPAAHKETLHYKKWREEVADMMEKPRYSVKSVSYTHLTLPTN